MKSYTKICFESREHILSFQIPRNCEEVHSNCAWLNEVKLRTRIFASFQTCIF